MNVLRTVAILMIVVAAVVGIAPQFTDCASHGNYMTTASGMTVPMTCHWTARGEVAVAAPLLITGGFLATSRSKSVLQMASILGAVLGVFVILLPTVLIGTCANPDMICNTLMQPLLILAGIVIIALSAVGFLLTRRGEGGPWVSAA